MRLIGAMTVVCLLLLLAMIPACLQFARACGVNAPSTVTTVAAAAVVAGLMTRRG